MTQTEKNELTDEGLIKLISAGESKYSSEIVEDKREKKLELTGSLTK